jgi:hypothetical protein
MRFVIGKIEQTSIFIRSFVRMKISPGNGYGPSSLPGKIVAFYLFFYDHHEQVAISKAP